jgi:two-component system, chemotaxis family, chemotaxis protein CheY
MADSVVDILLVEDDQDAREVFAAVLSEAGYQVATCEHGAEALKYLRGGQALPRVILLDLMMPVMNGWQFNEELRKDPKLSSIPVVVFSAHGDLPPIQAVDHLRKPVQMDRLLATVSKFCGPGVSAENHPPSIT